MAPSAPGILATNPEAPARQPPPANPAKPARGAGQNSGATVAPNTKSSGLSGSGKEGDASSPSDSAGAALAAQTSGLPGPPASAAKPARGVGQNSGATVALNTKSSGLSGSGKEGGASSPSDWPRCACRTTLGIARAARQCGKAGARSWAKQRCNGCQHEVFRSFGERQGRGRVEPIRFGLRWPHKPRDCRGRPPVRQSQAAELGKTAVQPLPSTRRLPVFRGAARKALPSPAIAAILTSTRCAFWRLKGTNPETLQVRGLAAPPIPATALPPPAAGPLQRPPERECLRGDEAGGARHGLRRLRVEPIRSGRRTPAAPTSGLPGPPSWSSGISTEAVEEGIVPQLGFGESASASPQVTETSANPMAPSAPGILAANLAAPAGQPQPANAARPARGVGQNSDANIAPNTKASGSEATLREAGAAVVAAANPPNDAQLSAQASDKSKDPGLSGNAKETAPAPGNTVPVDWVWPQAGGYANFTGDATSQDSQADSAPDLSTFPSIVASSVGVGPKASPAKSDPNSEIPVDPLQAMRRSSDTQNGPTAPSADPARPAAPDPPNWDGAREYLGQIMSSRHPGDVGQSELQVDLKSDSWGPVSVRAVLSNGQFGAEIQVSNHDAHTALTEGLTSRRHSATREFRLQTSMYRKA